MSGGGARAAGEENEYVRYTESRLGEGETIQAYVGPCVESCMVPIVGDIGKVCSITMYFLYSTRAN